MKNVWEQIHSERSWGRYPNEELVRFIGKKKFSIPKEKRREINILEIGCGQGANLWFLAKEGFTVYGIDISESAIKKAEEHLIGEYNVKANLETADARKLPYENDFFDIVIDVSTIQHIPFQDHIKSYKDIFRILKSGCCFWSFHIAEGCWGYGTGELIDYKTFENVSEDASRNHGMVCMPSDTDLSKLLTECGFKVNSIEKHKRTYENQTKEVIHWIIEANKPLKR